MRGGLAVVSFVLVGVVAAGCDALVPPPSRPPILDAVVRMGGSIDLVDPAQLAGSPISADDAVALADRKFSGEFVGGKTVVWGAFVVTPAGRRAGWIVVRGDPRDQELTGDGFAMELTVIDAITGRPVDIDPGRAPRFGPIRRGVPIPAVPSPAAVDSAP